MTQWLILREVAPGDARWLGITPDTALDPQAIADHWATGRADLSGTVRLHFCDMTQVTTVDTTPVVSQTADSTVVPPTEVFADPPIIEVPTS